jgi:regulator of protease activity HflC (stomatin/prohibitin superfamily)
MAKENIIFASSATVPLETILAVVIVILVIIMFIFKALKVIQQGNVGVVKRLGQFHSVREPGLTIITPFVDYLERVDVREEPWTGDHQTVITKDNVSILVNATIFAQVVDVKKALFEVSDYQIAINNVAEAALRSVVGNMTLDEVLTERELINAELQKHMEPLAEKWGVHLNRIEVIDIIPPKNILDAMALQKEADQQKRALIHKSEGEQQAAINIAKGQRQSAIEIAEGQKRSAILKAEGDRQSQILIAEGQRQKTSLEAEGKALAIEKIYSAIHQASPTPEILAILQLETLGQVALSDNAKLVVPVETAGLLGATSVLKDIMNGISSAPEVNKLDPPNTTGSS